MERRRFKRALLKVSGELLGKRKGIEEMADELLEVLREGREVAVVPGGGDLMRGVRAGEYGVRRETADLIGMLGTMINGLLLRDALRERGAEVLLFSALPLMGWVPPYSIEEARKGLSSGKAVILTGGTGNPYLTTDTTAVLRALELDCEVVLKGTKVDGVYEEDPILRPEAKRFETISYQEILQKGLKVMDQAAISLCMEHRLPIIVFNLSERGSMKRVLEGEKIGTLVG